MDMESTVATAENETSLGIAGVEFKKLGYSLFVWMPSNKMECRCSYVPRALGPAMALDELRGYLKQSELREGIDEDALKDFAVKAAAGQSLSLVLLASGIPPVPGKVGWMTYSVQACQKKTQVEADNSLNVDFKSVQTFINVAAGDEIARIFPPEPGLSGKNVIGEPILPIPVYSFEMKIGKNINTKEEGSLLFAETPGRVCIVSNEISVEEEYLVQGDVNFRVGSIVFNGHVEIRGDVLDDFSIIATKGLLVSGNIGACTIKSDGDISFCGMDGQERGTIICGGTIRANFIHDSLVECAGDVLIDVELHNSHLKSLGKIVVNKGAIVGGNYIALGGIETMKAGSLASVKTNLSAGVDYHDVSELELLLSMLEKNNAQFEQVFLSHEIEHLRKERKGLQERYDTIKSRSAERANPKINVKKTLYDNTFLGIDMLPKQKITERDGPLSAIENTIEGGLRFLSMTSLDFKADEIERAFVKEFNKEQKH